MLIKKTSVLLLLLLLIKIGFAQPATTILKIMVTPDHADWLYKKGEQTTFTIQVFKYNVPLQGVDIQYEIGPEQMTPTQKGTATLKDGKIVLHAASMDQPGFLRCIVTCTDEGKKYRNMATVGYDVDAIKPTVTMPVDFDSFWQQAKDSLAKIPMDVRMKLLPDRCTEKVNTYEVNMQNYGNTRFYGVLCVPKAPGHYPALLIVPGAGVRSYAGDVATAEKGVITLQIGIHGIPVTMTNSVYDDLITGILKDYYNYNLDNRDRFYYKRVYMGCIRANDVLTHLPEFDGKNLAVMGGSQGGALALVTGALDPRVICVADMYPALADVTGYLHGRVGGWPHYFNKANIAYNNTKEKLATIPYYDAVNFAKKLKVPIKMTWGYNDEICPPTTSYAVYNSITAPKSKKIYNDTGHWGYPEQNADLAAWLYQQLSVTVPPVKQ